MRVRGLVEGGAWDWRGGEEREVKGGDKGKRGRDREGKGGRERG